MYSLKPLSVFSLILILLLGLKQCHSDWSSEQIELYHIVILSVEMKDIRINRKIMIKKQVYVPRNQYISTLTLILRDISVALLCLNKFVKCSILKASYIYTDRLIHTTHRERLTDRPTETENVIVLSFVFSASGCVMILLHIVLDFSLSILESLVRWKPLILNHTLHKHEDWVPFISIPVVFDIVSGTYSAFSVCNGDEYKYK